MKKSPLAMPSFTQGSFRRFEAVPFRTNLNERECKVFEDIVSESTAQEAEVETAS